MLSVDDSDQTDGSDELVSFWSIISKPTAAPEQIHADELLNNFGEKQNYPKQKKKSKAKSSLLTNFDRWKYDFFQNETTSAHNKPIDAYILNLITIINEHPDYYTTSSCSGRILLHASSSSSKTDFKCLYVTHEQTNINDILNCVTTAATEKRFDTITFKLETLIIHVICRHIDCAKQLLNIALQSGFRNSGLIFSRQDKITLSVRSTQSLEIPFIIDGLLCVDKLYVEKIIHYANDKMMTNFQRIDELSDNV
ncbi:unnamed protein product, partial [Didymodactylos carnosus]